MVPSQQVEIKVVPFHIIQENGGFRGITPVILNLGARLKQVADFTLQPLYPLGNNYSPHRIGGWVGPIAGLDILEKKKICFCFWNLNPGPSTLQLELMEHFILLQLRNVSLVRKIFQEHIPERREKRM